MWPLLSYVIKQSTWKKGDGPIGLILTPTRELCQQVYQETKKYAKAYSLKTSCIYGGVDKLDQFKQLRNSSVAILVATPGRLIDMIHMKATHLRSVSYVILDEADRMLDMGFEPQVRSIVNAIRPDRQTLLFSATFPKMIDRLVRDLLTDPLKIEIGHVNQVSNERSSSSIKISESYTNDHTAQREI
jgi:ATP-dependent RNA helicase DDX42